MFFSLSPLFFIFPTTDLKHNNPCNYSACLVPTILNSFVFCLFKFDLFFALIFYVLSKTKWLLLFLCSKHVITLTVDL